MKQVSRPAADTKLIQIVDAAFADAARRSGEWLVCHAGCTQCCHGVFEITLLDAARLQQGLAHLRVVDPECAARVEQRALQAVEEMSPDYPGDPETGILNDDEDAFEAFANEEPCPALDPASGRCDLYEHRPITCRVFGPPIRSEGGIGVCELCYHGATDDQIASCEIHSDPDEMETQLLDEVERSAQQSGYTVVAFALAKPATVD